MADNESLFPSLNENESDLIENVDEDTDTEALQDVSNLGIAPQFDFKNKKINIVDGKVVTVSGKDALEQWIYLLLQTYQDEYGIYKGTDFYCNVTKDVIGNKLDDYWESELESEIEKRLLLNQYIESVTDFEVTKDVVNKKDVLNITFTVNTYNSGIIEIQDTIEV